MLSQEKFKKLLNGSGIAGGSKLLAAEIAGLERENDQAVAELGAIPAKRADLILTDDAGVAIDRIEARERELERLLERNNIQLLPLKERLSELRRIEQGPRIAHHQRAMDKIESEIASAIEALIALNSTAERALQDAVAELGDHASLMTVVYFGGCANKMSLEIWRGNLERQRERIAAQSKPRQPYKPPVDINDMENEISAMIVGKRRPSTWNSQ